MFPKDKMYWKLSKYVLNIFTSGKMNHCFYLRLFGPLSAAFLKWDNPRGLVQCCKVDLWSKLVISLFRSLWRTSKLWNARTTLNWFSARGMYPLLNFRICITVWGQSVFAYSSCSKDEIANSESHCLILEECFF